MGNSFTPVTTADLTAIRGMFMPPQVVAAFVLVWLSAAPTVAAPEGCASYRGTDAVRHPIAVYDTPPALGGEPVIEMMTFDPRYGYEGRPLPAFDPAQSSVLFEIEYETGAPRTERSLNSISTGGTMTLLVLGNAPGDLGPTLSAAAAAPVLEPLATPDFEATGETFEGYDLVAVEGAAVDRSFKDVGVKFGANGEIASILACDRPEAVPNPTCSIRESAGRLDFRSTFLRNDAGKIDAIRKRSTNFVTCLLKG